MNTKLKNNNRLDPFQLVPKLFTWGRVERELADCSLQFSVKWTLFIALEPHENCA